MSGLARLRNMFRVPDLRKKILFTIFIILIFRIGSHIPVPYVDFESVQNLSQNARDNPNGGVLGLLNTFSGGALTSVSVFFLGIMPYITASIIMQLLGVVIPKLEEWQNEGQTGQKKITQWTRYLTVALALMQSTAFVFVLKSGNGGLLGQSNFALPENVVLIPNFTAYKAIMIVMTWTAGTALVMWLGELITQRGIGNGMSMLIFTSVVSRLPYQGAVIYRQNKWQFFVLLLVIVAMVFAIVTVESGQRRIPVQFAKRVVGRPM
jgi:preprotein translocase subunit SecY